MRNVLISCIVLYKRALADVEHGHDDHVFVYERPV